jgi:broad specificity phosphatase PhoE
MRKPQHTERPTSEPRTKLFLVRHGATAANLAKPYKLLGSKPDSELAREGMEQARAAGEALLGAGANRVYCSPLKRARLSAEIMAGVLGLPVRVEPRLIEADVGLWAGLTWEEIEQRWPTEARGFHENAERNGYLGGENYAQVLERTLPVVEHLVREHEGESLVLVGHGVVNRVLLAHWLGQPLHHARGLPQDNAGINVIEFRDGRAAVLAINAKDHLVRVPV